MLLKDFTKDTGFIVLQTRGEEGYDLAAPQYSSEMKAEDEDGIKVYEFSLKDDYTKSAKISIKKQMSVNKNKYVPEVGARFQIIDPHGDVVDTLTTNEKEKQHPFRWRSVSIPCIRLTAIRNMR